MLNARYWLPLVLIGGVFVGCDTTALESAVDDFSIVIGLPPIHTDASVLITDAATGELVTAMVETRFGGSHGDAVIDLYSDPLAAVDVKGGILTFGLDNAVVPSPEAPALVRATLRAPGYLPATKTLTIEEVGRHDFAVRLVRESAPPTGVVIATQPAASTDASGATAEPVDVRVAGEAATEGAVGLEAPAGTVFLDESGRPLTGALTAKVVYYEAREVAAVEAVPEDLLAPVNGAPLTMLAATDLALTDASGRTAARLQRAGAGKVADGSYTLDFTLDAATFNELRALLRLVFFGADQETRTLIDQEPEVTDLGNGRVRVRYVLSDSLFRQAVLVIEQEQSCEPSVAVNRNGNTGPLDVSVSADGFFKSRTLGSGRSALTFRNVTPGPKHVSVQLPHTTVTQSADLCAAGTTTLDLPAPPPALIDATVNVELQCANPDERVRVTNIPGASAVYRASDAPSGTSWRAVSNLSWSYDAGTQSLTGGSAKVSGVEKGRTYDFKLTYDGNVEATSLTIDGPTVTYLLEIDDGICR